MTANVHIHLRVRDIEASRVFYEALFGEPPVKVRPGYVKFLPALGPVNLAMTEGDGRDRPAAVDHVGIQVDAPQIVTRELERVRAAGLPVRVEMGVDCCHANSNKFWATDPDGVQWEIYHLNHDLRTTLPMADACRPGATPPRGDACCAP